MPASKGTSLRGSPCIPNTQYGTEETRTGGIAALPQFPEAPPDKVLVHFANLGTSGFRV